MKGAPLPKPPGQKHTNLPITVVDWDDIGMTLPLQKTTDELQKWMVCRCYLRYPETNKSPLKIHGWFR